MTNTLTMQVKDKEIKTKIINMKGKYVFTPFFMACSYYTNYERENPKGHGCEKGLLGYDDRVCCECNFYDGGSVVALDWGDEEEINFLLYPYYSFGAQFSLNEIKEYLEKISATGEVCEEDILGNITIKKYEVKNPTIL